MLPSYHIWHTTDFVSNFNWNNENEWKINRHWNQFWKCEKENTRLLAIIGPLISWNYRCKSIFEWIPSFTSEPYPSFTFTNYQNSTQRLYLCPLKSIFEHFCTLFCYSIQRCYHQQILRLKYRQHERHAFTFFVRVCQRLTAWPHTSQDTFVYTLLPVSRFIKDREF